MAGCEKTGEIPPPDQPCLCANNHRPWSAHRGLSSAPERKAAAMKTSSWQRPYARALMTDLYELTMAYGYWRTGKADQEAVFHLFFRNQPFDGGFAICAGLADCIQYLEAFRFEKSDLDYLAKLKGNDGRRLFHRAFLKYLGKLRLRL